MAAWIAVGTKKCAAASLSFREEEMGNSEKFCILLSCWKEKCGGRAKFGGRDGLSASLNLVYAENGRRKLMADILRSGLEPEGPRNTAESDKRE